MMTLQLVIVSAPLMALRNAWWPNTVCRSQATSRVYLAANEPVKHRGRREGTSLRNLHLRTRPDTHPTDTRLNSAFVPLRSPRLHPNDCKSDGIRLKNGSS
jgi:hypothetical protein